MEISTELRKITLDLYNRLVSGDTSFIARLMTTHEGGLVIGTDPDEWWAGHETIVRMFKAQEKAFAGASYTADPQAYRHGDVGWVADQVKLVMADGAEISMRFTRVFEREAGEWKIVQSHASIGVPNEETGFGDI